MSKEILLGRKFIVLNYDPAEKSWHSASQPFKSVREARDFVESMERSGTVKGKLIIVKQTD